MCSILRVTVIRLKETPKYLLAKGDDAAVVAIYQDIAKKYQRPCSLTVDALESMGAINSTYGKSRYSLSELWAHFHGLFVTRKLAISTILIWISWLLIGNPNSALHQNNKTDVPRPGIPTVLCVSPRLSCQSWCQNGRVRAILSVEKLHAQQRHGHIWASGCCIYVQHQAAWPEVHYGNWSTHHHGLLLRLYCCEDSGSERGLELCHCFYVKYLLWNL